MSESLQIQVSHADVGRRFDQLVIGLFVLAIGLTWLSGPGNPWRFAGFAALLGLSWLLPRVFNASRRAGACNPASLCAQGPVPYRGLGRRAAYPVARPAAACGGRHVSRLVNPCGG